MLSHYENAHEEAIWCVAWGKNANSNSELIATGSLDDNAKVWTKKFVFYNFFLVFKFFSIILSIFFTISLDNKLQEQYIFEGHALGVMAIDLNHDGTIAATNSLDSNIRLYDLETGVQMKTIDAGPLDSWTVVYSPDSKFLATCSQSGKILLYSSETGEKLGKELDSNGKFTICIAIVINIY